MKFVVLRAPCVWVFFCEDHHVVASQHMTAPGVKDQPDVSCGQCQKPMASALIVNDGGRVERVERIR